MKIMKYGIWLLMLFALAACGGGSSDSSGPTPEPAVREMQLGVNASGFIEEVGDVDTFHLRPTATRRYLKIHCSEATSGSGVDLLVTVFEERDGQRYRLFGRHKLDGATLSANMDLWVYIDNPDKDLYITVRDYMDDDANSNIAYNLIATLEDSVNGNHDLTTAQSMTVGTAVNDEIGEPGEADIFTFTPTAEGVYRVSVDHDKPDGGTNVKLTFSLYDHNGNLIERLSDPRNVMLAHLTVAEGPYYVVVEDTTNMYGDLMAPYDLNVEPVTVAESRGNDTKASATLLESDAEGNFIAAGTIDYGCASTSADPAVISSSYPDADWYEVVIGDPNGATTYHFVELTIDDGPTVAGTAPVRVVVYDNDDNIVTSHTFAPSSAAYVNQFRAENGHYFVSVSPLDSERVAEGVNYDVRLKEVSLDDDRELLDDNTATTAVDLMDGDDQTGIISYHSDVDWYYVDVDTSSAKVLSVDFTTPGPSIVDYQVSIWRGTQMIKRVTDNNGSDGPTHLKTSILIEADGPSTTARYDVKINDAQNSEGSSVVYTVDASIAEVPTASPGHLTTHTSDPMRYYGEAVEEAATQPEDNITLGIFSTLQPIFDANTDWLNFRGTPAELAARNIATSTDGNGNTVITFPWITGYIDYEGDRDFFKLDLGKLDPTDDTVTQWYYDIEVRMVVPGGTEVEHVWKLHRDRDKDRSFLDHGGTSNGYIGIDGDTSLGTDPVNASSPAAGGDDTLWVGYEWAGNSDFYFAISDFDYRKIPFTDDDNPNPDADWGYDAPYYFTFTLTYHPGQLRN